MTIVRLQAMMVDDRGQDVDQLVIELWRPKRPGDTASPMVGRPLGPPATTLRRRPATFFRTTRAGARQ